MNNDLKLILPKNGVVLDLEQGERLYFLAGPIRGGGDWQTKAIKLLHEKDPFCWIACPCRYDWKHEMSHFSIQATQKEKEHELELPEYELEFPNQTMWERYYLEQASYYGSVIFWLPCEDKQNPRDKQDGPYARDSYGELGRWSLKSANYEKHAFKPYTSAQKRVNLVVGAEKDFHGLTVIQKNFDADHQKPFQIYSTLEETITEAVKLGKKTNPMPMKFND